MGDNKRELLREWQPPQGIKRITIFGDNDANFVGQAAAYGLRNALVVAPRLQITVKIPEVEGWDLNDIIKNEIATERYTSHMPELRMVHHDIESPREPVSDS